MRRIETIFLSSVLTLTKNKRLGWFLDIQHEISGNLDLLRIILMFIFGWKKAIRLINSALPFGI